MHIAIIVDNLVEISTQGEEGRKQTEYEIREAGNRENTVIRHLDFGYRTLCHSH